MVLSLLNNLADEGPHTEILYKRGTATGGSRIAFIILIPILVILSGIFAGLTLGYMSLDETQLNVLSISGTEKQRKYAAQIIPIRKNGHLLLITLILANMITNETLPVVSDQVLPGSIYGVIISTALIVIFAEIIPQTVCTRYGLVIGAKMAMVVRGLIILFWPIAFPLAKVLELILGPHHGIIYRRGELKELIAMHADDHPQGQGGELKHDTAAIIGHTLDLQEKVVSDAMTGIDKVFMLSYDSVLDYATLTRIHQTGHSRIPVYTEVELGGAPKGGKVEKVKKIVGVLLVKQCVLLDPEDATPLRSIPLNKVPAIAFDEPLLKVLDRFQEGRSHIAIVTRLSSKRAASVKEVVKPALTKRFLNRFRDSDSSGSEDDDIESGKKEKEAGKLNERRLAPLGGKGLEQTMPADALLPRANAEKFLQGLDQYTHPMGIITLEDVLEELIGEEIYDEFDLHGPHALPASSYLPPEAQAAVSVPTSPAAASAAAPAPKSKPPPSLKVTLPKMTVPSFGGLAILRSRSAPGTPRGTTPSLPSTALVNPGDGTGPAGEKLDHIQEAVTPSPTEKASQDASMGPPEQQGGDVLERASTFDSLPVYNPTTVEHLRSSSQPPSPGPNKLGLSTSGAATPTGTTASARTNLAPPSLLTEAVLRGRQARLASAPESAVAPSGTRPAMKGRFKSTRLDGAPPSPVITVPRTSTLKKSGEVTQKEEGVE